MFQTPSPSPTPPPSCSSSAFQIPSTSQAEYFAMPHPQPTIVSPASSDRGDADEDQDSASSASDSSPGAFSAFTTSLASSSASSSYAVDEISTCDDRGTPHSSSTPSTTTSSPASASGSVSRRGSHSQSDDILAHLDFAHAILAAEARAVLLASERLRTDPTTRAGFADAIRTVLDRVGVAESIDTALASSSSSTPKSGKVVWTGVGKSGLIARKLSATLASLGVTSMFLHPVEALHGDLGLVTPGQDVVIALSHSGSSAEILTLLPHIVARRVPIVAFTARRDSKLAQAASAWVDCRTASVSKRAISADGKRGAVAGGEDDVDDVDDEDAEPRASSFTTHPDELREAPPSHLPAAPTSSTSVALAMGDSLVLAIANALQLGVPAFKLNHPGGALGDALAKVHIAAPSHMRASVELADLR